MSDLVSIIIPTFNRAHLIGQTLDSVLVQTYKQWECIIVDDGSTDYTDELLEFYTEKDDRIKYYHRPIDRLKGANACRNYGFEVSSGDYINWLDSDDLFSENKIEWQVKKLNKKEKAIATTKWGVLKNKKLKPYNCLETYKNFDDPEIFLEALFKSEGYFPIHSYLIPKVLINKVGLWNEYLKVNQDSEFIIRVLCVTQDVLFCDCCDVIYRGTFNDNVSLINEENYYDYYHSWLLIESYLLLRFKKKIVSFEEFKRRIYKKIPLKFNYLIREEPFFQNVVDEENKRNSLSFKIRRKLSETLSFK